MKPSYEMRLRKENKKLDDPCVIVINRKTRDRIKNLAKKSQTYDEFISELISASEGMR